MFADAVDQVPQARLARSPSLVPRTARTTLVPPSSSSTRLVSTIRPLNAKADWNEISAPASTENTPLL